MKMLEGKMKTIISDADEIAQFSWIAKWAIDCGTGWRLHGLGMIQNYLPSGDRIHIWHPQLSIANKDISAHSHRFDMESYVLCGAITHEEVTLFPGEEYRIINQYAHHYEETNETTNIETHFMRIVAGQKYFFPKGTYHIGGVEDFAITYIKRFNISGISHSLTKVGSKTISGRGEESQKEIKSSNEDIIKEILSVAKQKLF